MIQLTDEEKEFIRNELKPLLVENDIKGVIKRCCELNKNSPEVCNVLPMLMENGIDLFENIDYIPDYMFRESDIESIVIPEGIREIRSSAFWGCKKLTSVTFPSTLSRIGKAAFENCVSLKDVYLPENVSSIGSGCFNECNRIAITTPKRVGAMPKLRIPKNEIDWYKNHLKTIRAEAENTEEVIEEPEE